MKRNFNFGFGALALSVFFSLSGEAQTQNVFPQTGNVGLGTAQPTQQLSIGSGNIMLPSANRGTDGNLYFGGITDAGETGLRLFGGLVNGDVPAGFIDVRTSASADGLRIRVDNINGAAERMRITAGGNVGIGTTNPGTMLDVAGTIRTLGGLTIMHGPQLGPGPLQVLATVPTDGLKILVDTVDGETERMRVTASGNVGIGTGSPMAMLDVAGTTRTRELAITGGSDLAESFEVSAEIIEPGMLVSIDPARPGQMRISSKAYDRTVAGVISGAYGLNPGLTMGQERTMAAGHLPVALTGRVYTFSDVANGPIEPGDLLTTSDIPGYAMKVTDYTKAQGAIIGKAMSALSSGRGLVLTLVSLQ